MFWNVSVYVNDHFNFIVTWRLEGDGVLRFTMGVLPHIRSIVHSDLVVGRRGTVWVNTGSVA